MTAAATIEQLLRRHRFTFANEAELQDGIALVLAAGAVAHEREVVLRARDRIDFVCEGRVGIEVKVEGALADVTRQLARYAESASIGHLILVTSRLQHRRVPTSIGSKPVTVVYIGGLF